MSPAWFKEGPRLRVYLAVRSAGAAGLGIRGAHKVVPLLSYAQVANLLYGLKLGGYIVTPPGDDVRGRYCVTAACTPPRVRGQQLHMLVELLADCAGGVSLAVLANETGLRPSRIITEMRGLIAAGQVEQFLASPAHGGRAYRLLVDAEPLLATLPHLLPLGEAPAALAVAPPEPAFKLADDGGFCMRMDDGTRLALSPDYTRRMFRFLDQLGGTCMTTTQAGAAS